MRIIIISLIVSFTGIQPLFATKIRWGCSTPILSSIGVVGDSRADVLSKLGTAGYDNDIQKATFNGKAIFPPNTVWLQGLAQFGSMASEWVEKIQECQNTSKVSFDVPQYTIISLGGNDMLNYIKKKYDMKTVKDSEKVMNQFSNWGTNILNSGKSLVRQVRKTSLKSFLRSPVRTITNLVKGVVNVALNVVFGITGNPMIKYPDFQTQWEWQDATETDKIVTDMKYIIPHFLDQSSPLIDRSSGKDHPVKDAHGNPQFVPRSVMLNTVAPAAPISFIIYGWTVGKVHDFPFYYFNVIKTFNGLRTKYIRDLYPSMQKKYGTQIVLLDTYNHFSHNILRQNSSEYLDGIHFTFAGKEIKDTNGTVIGHEGEGGQQYWGRTIALTMSYFKWLTLDSPGTLYADVDVGAGVATINSKAIADGIDTTVAEGTDHDALNHGFTKYFPQDPIILTYMEIDYEFDNDMSYFVRNGDSRSFRVRGDIRTLYEGNGGPDGRLGFPIQDEVTGSIFESYRSQVFECGTIIKNYFDLITPQKIIMNEATPECLAKKARDAN